MSAQAAYTGVENLDAMREAVNYNRYLLQTVHAFAPPGGRVIDFGAGNGQFASALTALGVDVSTVEADEMLRADLQKQGLPSAATLRELEGTFSYAYSLNVLEHIEHDEAVLREIHEKLQPAGRLLIFVPAFPILYSSMDAKVGHVRRYTKSQLKQRVETAGFRVQQLGHVDSLGFLASLVFKAIGNADGVISPNSVRLYDRLVFPMSRLLDTLATRWFGKNLLLHAVKI